MPKTNVLGIDFDNGTLPEAAARLLALAGQAGGAGAAAANKPADGANGPGSGGDVAADGRPRRGAAMVVTPNAEIGWTCLHDGEMRALVNGADYVSPDGAGVVLASRILGRPLPQRVAGFDLFCALLPQMEARGLTLFLLGAAPGVAERAALEMRRRWPRLKIVGTHDGYFQDDAPVERLLDEAAPDFIVVAMGSPRQERWMARHRGRPGWGVMMGLGGTLDVFAGDDRRAPAFFIRHNLEWLYRLFRHPDRIVRMMRLPAYVLRAAAARLIGSPAAGNDRSRK